MRTGRPSVLGLVIPVTVLAVAGCMGDADRPEPVSADAAVASYRAPAGAPAFCTTLAGSTRIAAIPGVVGALAAGTDTVEARLELTDGIGDLRAVLDEVRAEDGHERLGAAMEQLIAALTAAMDSPLTDAVRTDVSGDLDAVGRHAQTVCQFPA